MYNSITEDIIRGIPQIGDIDNDRLPQELTKIFAQIVSLRKNLSEDSGSFSEEMISSLLKLRRLTNNLETFLLINPDHPSKESAAFVSATSHYLQLKIKSTYYNTIDDDDLFLPDTISPVISTIILFLIANSQADAAEVTIHYAHAAGSKIESLLYSYISGLALGNLSIFLEPIDLAIFNKTNIRKDAENFLWQNIAMGMRNLGMALLGETSDDIDYFDKVIELAVLEQKVLGQQSIYTGPYHLAKLLKMLQADIVRRGVVNTRVPVGVDNDSWSLFLKKLAEDRPYLWENHFEVIQTDFLNSGTSAILTFPTGAGKSTISELKIASTLLSGKKVIYLVPTHALREQINANLKKVFADYLTENTHEVDAEYTELELQQNIIVMTPERCLALLGVNEGAFENVGLVVFDEFHLIHGKGGSRDRRSIDAMFCLLFLFNVAASADYLLISAMVENSEQIAGWISSVTNRQCLVFDSAWKPTRQMLGCLVFQDSDIVSLNRHITLTKRKISNQSPSKKLRSELHITPYVFYSLKNIWESVSNDDYHITSILDEKILLSANKYWRLTPNRNEAAAQIAIHFGRLGIKTLVFVDTPIIANSTSKKIAAELTAMTNDNVEFKKANKTLFDNLTSELGNLKYSYISNDGNVGVHHGMMLPIERQINELSFKNKGGLTVVVATATLAQGINLPAEIVVISGDDRYDEVKEERERIPPHELLNAAGRAGRAGMSSQGAVFLIPGEIVTVENDVISSRWWDLKDEVFSKSDQCLKISDPLEHFLDSMSGNVPLDLSEKNILFRLKPEILPAARISALFKKSFYAYSISTSQNDTTFDSQVNNLILRRNELEQSSTVKDWIKEISIKTGIDPAVIKKLSRSIKKAGIDDMLDFTIVELIQWYIKWLTTDVDNFENVFTKGYTLVNFYKVLDLKKESRTIANIIKQSDIISSLLIEYVTGATYEQLEALIPAKSDSFLNNSRNFVLRLIPDISFAFGLFALTIIEMKRLDDTEAEISMYIKVLASCVREGFDEVQKLFYRYDNPQTSRVRIHWEFNALI